MIFNSSVCLFQPSPYSIADNSTSYFCTDCNSKSVASGLIYKRIYDDIVTRCTFAFCVKAFKKTVPCYGQCFAHKDRSFHLTYACIFQTSRKSGQSPLIKTTPKTYADNTFLPFNLLLASTFLPFLVDMRFLKPCSLLLCLFLGWYVLNIGDTSSNFYKACRHFLLSNMLITHYGKITLPL